ncbi:hypothetical protein CBL_01398 [Carabus blaptoides fortunei]
MTPAVPIQCVENKRKIGELYSLETQLLVTELVGAVVFLVLLNTSWIIVQYPNGVDQGFYFILCEQQTMFVGNVAHRTTTELNTDDFKQPSIASAVVYPGHSVSGLYAVEQADNRHLEGSKQRRKSIERASEGCRGDRKRRLVLGDGEFALQFIATRMLHAAAM